MPVTRLRSQGTVNAIFRIGDCLTARFPLQPTTAGRLEKEADAARELLGRTRFATPAPVAIGAPGPGYPLPWSVQTWVPGEVATSADPGRSTFFARDLAEFIQAVRTIDTRGRRFGGGGRGGHLPDHDEWLETCFQRSHDLLDVHPLRRLWQKLRELPRGDYPDTMTHGDLIPGNVLVAAGRLTGVLDVGGLGPADRALDLVGAWHLLETGPRRELRDYLDCDDLEWERGRAWAFQQAMGAGWYYRHTNPVMCRMALRTLARITGP
ncbi:aminoglycoside phosphotransferase family protein [Paractinoplanes rishiriensis]|nr:aminoglycoside phosphotransferase family protein [Actinoplanes rishiriensis]